VVRREGGKPRVDSASSSKRRVGRRRGARE
jgi:hypothetical protein